jgi:hypothetical protein
MSQASQKAEKRNDESKNKERGTFNQSTGERDARKERKEIYLYRKIQTS